MTDFEARQAPAAEQEFKLTPADFERVRQLIYQRAGISLHAGKQAMVYSRLSRRLRETRFSTPRARASSSAATAPRPRRNGRSS